MIKKAYFFCAATTICVLLAIGALQAADKGAPNVTTADKTPEAAAPTTADRQSAENVAVGKSVSAAASISWQVTAGGGGRGASTGYIVNGTVGQTAVGPGSSSSYNLNSGYWQVFGGGGGSCCVLAGDASDDGMYNISDAVYIINNVFKGGATPVCCDAADANGDGAYNISDAVHIINNVFKGGSAPVCGSAGSGPC
jgi:hypothetical protein